MTTFAHGTRGAALDEVLRLLYPDSFQELIPVYKHKAVDLAIHKWDHIAGTLEQVETQLKLAGVDCEALDKNDTPSPSALAGDKPGSKDEESGAAAAAPAPLSGWAARKAKKEAKRIADLIEQRAKLQEELVAADANVLALRAEALSKPTDTAYFATFNNMRDALGAARGEIGAVANINMSSIPAPGADEINWEALWGNYHQVVWRTVLAVFLVIVVIAFPIGPITGAMTNLDLAVCGGSADTNDIYWPWFCQDSFNIARFIITGALFMTAVSLSNHFPRLCS